MIEEVSVVMSAYDEEEGVGKVIKEWVAVLEEDESIKKWEIVVCDDGSRDDTGSIIDNLASQDARIMAFHNKSNLGASISIRRALQRTKYSWIMFTDADDQFPAINIRALISAACTYKSAYAFSGVRQHKKDKFMRRVGAVVTTKVVNWSYKTCYRDVSSIFKLVNGDLARALILESTGLNFSVELSLRVIEADKNWIEVPILHHSRSFGKPSWQFKSEATKRAAFVGYMALRKLLFNKQILRPIS